MIGKTVSQETITNHAERRISLLADFKLRITNDW